MAFFAHLKSIHTEGEWLSWVDSLSEHDYVVIDHFLNESIYQSLRSYFKAKLPEFKQAGIGALDDRLVRHDIRGDQTYWLDPQRDGEIASFWQLLEETKQVLNRYCYLSLSGYEFHFANYPPTAHYEKHLDQFEGRNNRMISLVIYLNEDWQPGDGGELELFLADGRELKVEPLKGRAVLFKSASMPHRVCRSYRDRYSLTGWFLYQPLGLGQFGI